MSDGALYLRHQPVWGGRAVRAANFGVRPSRVAADERHIAGAACRGKGKLIHNTCT